MGKAGASEKKPGYGGGLLGGSGGGAAGAAGDTAGAKATKRVSLSVDKSGEDASDEEEVEELLKGAKTPASRASTTDRDEILLRLVGSVETLARSTLKEKKDPIEEPLETYPGAQTTGYPSSLKGLQTKSILRKDFKTRKRGIWQGMEERIREKLRMSKRELEEVLEKWEESWRLGDPVGKKDAGLLGHSALEVYRLLRVAWDGAESEPERKRLDAPLAQAALVLMGFEQMQYDGGVWDLGY